MGIERDAMAQWLARSKDVMLRLHLAPSVPKFREQAFPALVSLKAAKKKPSVIAPKVFHPARHAKSWPCDVKVRHSGLSATALHGDKLQLDRNSQAIPLNQPGEVTGSVPAPLSSRTAGQLEE